tara:strand:- start:822 stop:1556 length:735 start_codon:yes stop_codon:yes gene_type:complete
MSILSCLNVYHYNHKLRLGNICDGGYVIADLSNNYDLIIGAGIANDISFEKAFIEKYGVKAIVFDGTETSGYELTKNEPNITYIEKNIASKNSQNNIGLGGIKPSTTNLVEYCYNKNNIFLKMDIEGAEWEYFANLPIEMLLKFKQIVIEFHFPRTINHFKVLSKIASTHYLIHYHANNNNQVVFNISNVNIPAVFECTYIRKDCCSKLKLNKEPFPTVLDYSNVKQKKEYIIDYPPFCYKQTI